MKRGNHPNRTNKAEAIPISSHASRRGRFFLRCLRLSDIIDMLVVRLNDVARNIVSHGFWKNV
jgi:hypothetical protein